MSEDIAVIIGAVVAGVVLFGILYFVSSSCKEYERNLVGDVEDNILALPEVTVAWLQEVADWKELATWGITWHFELSSGKYAVKISEQLYTFLDYDGQNIWSLKSRADSLEHAIFSVLTEVVRLHNDPSLIPIVDTVGMAKSARSIEFHNESEGGNDDEQCDAVD